MNVDNLNDVIYVEHFHRTMSNDEREEIKKLLNSHNIELNFIEEKDSVKASLFSAITIFFNEPLTKKIIADLLTSGAYDAIKFVVFCFLNNLKNRLSVNFNGEQKEVTLNLKFRTDNVEIIAPIPYPSNNEQYSAYMNMLHNSIVDTGKTKIPYVQNYEMYVIENDEKNSDLVKVKTMIEYAREQREKQQNKQDALNIDND